jgi:hypothetical protein
MKVFKLLWMIGCAGCIPVNLDATFTWGSNQSIEKTLKINQVQTDAQVGAGSEMVSEIASGVIAVAPLLLREVPSPTPTPAARLYELVVPVEPVIAATLPKVRKVRPIRTRRAARVIATPCPTFTPSPTPTSVGAAATNPWMDRFGNVKK